MRKNIEFTFLTLSSSNLRWRTLKSVPSTPFGFRHGDQAEGKCRKGESQCIRCCVGSTSRDHRRPFRAAVDYCRERQADLRLVGLVRHKLSDSTRGTAGERVRRSKAVRFELNRAAEGARAAGVPVSMILRAGNPMLALLREAAATDSGDVFYVGSPGADPSGVTRQPRRELCICRRPLPPPDGWQRPLGWSRSGACRLTPNTN